MAHLTKLGARCLASSARSLCVRVTTSHLLHHLLDCWVVHARGLPGLLLVLRASDLQRDSHSLISEQLVSTQLQTLLHVDHDGCDLLTKACLVELTGQLGVLRWDCLTKHHLSNFRGECVRIVSEDMVGSVGEFSGHVLEHLHKDLLWYLCLTERDSLCRRA